jgi:hypothetical protein
VKTLLNLQTMDRDRNEVVNKITIFSQKCQGVGGKKYRDGKKILATLQ